MKQLSLIEKAFFLKKVSLFKDLDLDLLIAIADKMKQYIYDKNEKIFEITHKPLSMYFIVKGSISLLNDKKNVIVSLSSENFFGDEALFHQKQRSYTAQCTEKTLLLTLSKNNLLTIFSECPDVAIKLLSDYTKIIDCRYIKSNELSK